MALVAIANGTSRFSPDFLSEFVLYALSAADLTMLVALVFVLARNVVKLVVERRRALPFARFRAKLVLLLLGMTVFPALLVLIVGGELIQTNISRWFNAPMDEVLSSANRIASDYYHDRQVGVADQSARAAHDLAGVDLSAVDAKAVRDLVEPDIAAGRAQRIVVYRARPSGPPAGSAPATLEPLVEVSAPSMPAGTNRSTVDAMAASAFGGQPQTSTQPLGPAGELFHAAVVVRAKDGRPAGVVVATDYLTGDVVA